MNLSFKRMVSTLVTVSTALSLTGIGLASQAYADQLTTVKVTLSDPEPATSSNYAITFKIKSPGTMGAVKFLYRIDASTSSTKPTNLSLAGVTFPGTNAVVSGASTDRTSNWTGSFDNTSGTVSFVATTAESVALNDQWTFNFNNVHNNDFSGTTCNGVPTGGPYTSDSCWIRITTYSDTGAVTPVDTSTTTYTVSSSVTVTATVDPTLQFKVNGIAASQTHDSETTTGTSTATTMPFGNLTIGTAKTMQQSLTVLTNANNGYSVYQKFNTSGNTQIMVGTYSGNIVNAFTGSGSAGWPEDSATPQSWISPTGTVKNINSSWIGMRTSNTGAGSFGADTWAPPAYNTTGVGKTVMKSITPDNGSTPTYVTYKMEANAYQPSDTYTGTMLYNVVGSY